MMGLKSSNLLFGWKLYLIDTNSIKQPDLYYFEAIKMTSQDYMYGEYEQQVFLVDFDQACDVIFMASK